MHHNSNSSHYVVDMLPFGDALAGTRSRLDFGPTGIDSNTLSSYTLSSCMDTSILPLPPVQGLYEKQWNEIALGKRPLVYHIANLPPLGARTVRTSSLLDSGHTSISNPPSSPLYTYSCGLVVSHPVSLQEVEHDFLKKCHANCDDAAHMRPEPDSFWILAIRVLVTTLFLLNIIFPHFLALRLLCCRLGPMALMSCNLTWPWLILHKRRPLLMLSFPNRSSLLSCRLKRVIIYVSTLTMLFTNRALKKLENTLIGWMMSKQWVKPMPISDLKISVDKIWEIRGQWKLIPLEKGYFNIQMEDSSGRDRIFRRRSWPSEFGIMCLQNWTPELNPYKISFLMVNVWVRIYELPQVYFMNT